jgi:hypothetical protein
MSQPASFWTVTIICVALAACGNGGKKDADADGGGDVPLDADGEVPGEVVERSWIPVKTFPWTRTWRWTRPRIQ